MKKILFIILSMTALQGCVETAIVAGAVTAVGAVNDPRTVGTQIDDSTIEVKAAYHLLQDDGLSNHTHINVISYNGVILAVGQAPNQLLIERAIKILSELKGVKKVHNQIKLGTPATFSTKANDAWITIKVKSELLTDDVVKGHNIKVVTESKVVYLMGLVDEEQARLAAEIASQIRGVERVIKVFE
jgi:osmotically-inducible protein OsmY